METVYVVGYQTESGDSGVVGYFDKEPTDGHLTAFFQDLMPDEFIDDPDEEVIKRMVFWEVYELNQATLPKAVKPIESI